MENKYNCDSYDCGYCYYLARPLTDEEDDRCEDKCCAYGKKEDFIKYAKEVYDIDITIVSSDKPDTFDTFFKSSNVDKNMTQEIAREILQSIPSLYNLQTLEEEAILTLLTPKKLKLYYKNLGDGDDEYECPNCGYELANGNFCCKCGQPLVDD